MRSECPCDNDGLALPANPAGLSRIAFRRNDWRTIRRALLAAREPEVALREWRPGSPQDLAMMIAEWWATLGDVLEFYNEEIANEAFLSTAVQAPSVTRLISLLGYRPRPGLAATATVGAIVSGRAAITVPQGFRFESVPAGGKQPQTFELDRETILLPGGRIDAQPAPALSMPEPGRLYLQGRVNAVATGDRLWLRILSADYVLTVTGVETTADKPVRTRLDYTAIPDVPASATASASRLYRASQSLPLWTFFNKPIDGTKEIHLAGMNRTVKAGEPVLLTQPDGAAILGEVAATSDLIWYANAPDANVPTNPPSTNALPVPHTLLTMVNAVGTGWTTSQMAVQTGWVEVGRLLDQPPARWTGTPASLTAVPPGSFPQSISEPVLVAGNAGEGVPAAMSATEGAATATVAVDPAFAADAELESPLGILTRLLVLSRGKTVVREVIGSGDARIPGQSFPLAKSPVTYLRSGASYVSTVTVLVNGEPWTEAETFYGQAADAAIFTLSETEAGITTVQFGDGVNGRRPPTGTDNVIARYRYGSGADAPAATKLSRIPSPLPGLVKILNPVGSGGGADPEPTDEIRSYAPRSVLTLGRAVSVADFEAFAAQAVAPERVRAVWAWDEMRQRTTVTVYVAGGPDKIVSAREALAAVGDPIRPVNVTAAAAVPIRLILTLLVTPGYEAEPIVAAATEALVGEDGLFSAARLRIGQPLFMSAVSAAVVPVAGVVTILETKLSILVTGGETELSGALHRVEEGEWFDLQPDRLTIGIEVDDV
jgi:predicted phage baseplate assembly protein